MSKGNDILDGWRKAIDRGELRFPRCEQCSAWNWYPLPRCRTCGSAEHVWTSVSPHGVLYSWTRVHRAFGQNGAAPVPYVTGIVDISESPGVRLVCLQDQNADEPLIGSPVRLHLQRTPAGGRWLFNSATRT